MSDSHHSVRLTLKSTNVRHMKLPPKRLITAIISLCVIIGGTYVAIQFGKGYRPTKDGMIKGTGLLAANSFPTGAEVYINDKLTTATDDTLNLTPGSYQVAIKKDGYLPWQKALLIQEELVSQTNATLFKAAPGLSPLTLAGALNITPSPDGQKIAFAVTVASSAAKNGLYILDMTSSTPLSQIKEPRQIARNTEAIDFSQNILVWSPDSTQLLAYAPEANDQFSAYLLPIANLTEPANLRDISVQLPVILAGWEEEIAIRETKQFAKLPLELQVIATQSATNVYFSPNDERVMYTSTGSATIRPNLIQTPPATNTQPEERQLSPGTIYVYDLIEDKNFLIGSTPKDELKPQKQLIILDSNQQLITIADRNPITPTPTAISDFMSLQDPNSFPQTATNFNTHYPSIYTSTFQWYPNSTHLIHHQDAGIEILEYDGQNLITVYSGPINDDFVYPWPDGKSLIILTNFNPSSALPENLYAIAIR